MADDDIAVLVDNEVLELGICSENHAAVSKGGVHPQQDQPQDIPGKRSPVEAHGTPSKIKRPRTVSVLSESEYFDIEKDHSNAIKFSSAEEKYLSRYLIYIDKKMRVRSKDDSDVAQTVNVIITKIAELLKSYPDFSGGELIECGSFYEDTKVGGPDEFDFQYMMKLEDFDAKVAQMSKINARHSNLESKTFFKLYKTKNAEEIVAKERHDAFKETIECILKDMFKKDAPVMTKKSGPAVKFVLTIPRIAEGKGTKSQKSRNVKIDLTMAYEVSSNHTFFNEVDLRSYASLLRSQDRLQCHFIPAHDFWKLSFTKTEKELMKKVSSVNYKGVCYRAIKILRDKVDVQDAMGDGILSSYPIKVTLMKETLHTHIEKTDAVEWTKEKVGKNVIKIARRVNYDGQKHQMHGIFIRNDNIMGESDKSYLESRRIIDELKNISRNYRQYALLNGIIWLVLMVASTALLTTEAVFSCLADWGALEEYCLDKANVEPPFPVNLPFLFAFSVLSWLILFANLAGIFLITAPMVTNRWKNVIFKVLPNLPYVYIVTCLASLTLIFFDIVLVFDYIHNKTCKRLGNGTWTHVVVGISMFITFVPHVLLLISYISSRAYYRGKRKEWFSRYDVMFFEFPFCRERNERQNDEQGEGLNQKERKRAQSLSLPVSDITSTFQGLSGSDECDIESSFQNLSTTDEFEMTMLN